MENTNEYNFLKNTIIRLQANYNSLGMRASGNWGESLESKVLETPTGIKMQILGANYTKWITPDGRGANAVKSPEAAKKLFPLVLRWMAQKGMQEDRNFAFRIALKWVYKGIKVPNNYNQGKLVDNVINEAWFREGIKIAGGSFISSITTDVLNRIKLSR